jgi:protein TonB
MGVSDITTVIKPSQAVAPKAESTNWAPPAKQTRKIDTSKFADFVDISKLDKRPSPVFRADPQYPSEMKRSGIGGHVVLECIVASDGSAQDAMAVSSTNQEFEKPAVDALLKWRFQPGMKDGRKRSTKVRLTINFTPPS